MRFSAALWPFCFGVRLSWATTSVPNPPLSSALGRAYLLRGNAVVFSRGFGRVCDELRWAGLWAEDLRCVGDRWVRRHLVEDHRARQLRGPVILIGHSCGGRYALHTARQLEPLGIAIDLLVCIDVAAPSAVPGNVRQAVNIYRTRRRLYPAGALRPVPGSKTVIDNIDLDGADSPVRARGLHHLNLTGCAGVQGLIVARALAVACAQEASGAA